MFPNKKGSILLVLKTLEEYTDEDHYLTQNQIVDKIYQSYGIELERKSVGSSLQLLEELDYDIVKGSKGGFALLSRTFDKTEATYLVDAIFSSKSIDGTQAKKVAESLFSCFSKYQRNDYSYIYKSRDINRTQNKQVLYNISIIHEAIKQGKRVGFQYLTYDKNGNIKSRNDGREYIVSPYYLVNNFGRYYLVCNYRDTYRPIQSFRVDFMTNIKIKNDWDLKNIEKLKNIPKDFSISKYMNEHIYMLGGDSINATLELDSESCVLYVKDWFGESAKINEKDGKIFASIKCNEQALYYWIMQYSDNVKVVSPKQLIERVKLGLTNALNRYNEN